VGAVSTTLTRRTLLLLAVAGLAEVVYLEEFHHHRGGVAQYMSRFKAIAIKPAQVLDLAVWKINLPTRNQQVTQPQLASFEDSAFQVVAAVQFTATCGGEAQPGSKYARSELREMNPDGSNAAWSTTSGTATMEITQRITHLPVAKPALVCGQIHNDDYLILVELDAKNLYVRYRDATAGVLDDDYQLGTFFDLKVQVTGGYVDVYYNGAHKVHQPMKETGCYFKAGCYVQSSTQTGDLPTAYGQVEISQLTITHA
jgi:Alginate lyase